MTLECPCMNPFTPPPRRFDREADAQRMRISDCRARLRWFSSACCGKWSRVPHFLVEGKMLKRLENGKESGERKVSDEVTRRSPCAALGIVVGVRKCSCAEIDSPDMSQHGHDDAAIRSGRQEWCRAATQKNRVSGGRKSVTWLFHSETALYRSTIDADGPSCTHRRLL